MRRTRRELHPELPINVSSRTNNQDFFPIPMEQVWQICGKHLKTVSDRFELKILQFVLMSNHFHLLCRDPGQNLSAAIAHLKVETTKDVNLLAGKINSLWGNRFHSTVITEEDHLINVIKYNFRNPVAAGICSRVEDYPWSTLSASFGANALPYPIEHHGFISENLLGTLLWLNERYTEKQGFSLKRALRRKFFEIPRDPKNLRAGGDGLQLATPCFEKLPGRKGG